MKHLPGILLSLVLMSVTLCPLHAQETASQHTRYAGRDFWVTRYNNPALNDFYLSGKHNAAVTFTYTTNNISQTVNVPANTLVKVDMALMLPASATAMETIDNKSLHIVSDSDIVVQLTCFGAGNDDGSLIYPSDRQKYGNVYYLNSLPNLPQSNGNNRGGFSIVATCDSVRLEIIPAQNLVGFPAGIPFNITLNRGETYSICSSASNTLKDISGTKIEVKAASCCNPINVFNTGFIGNAYWPYAGPTKNAGDQFFEQLLPASSWDTSYYVLPYCNNPYTIIKIVSADNNNPVSVNGTVIATLNAGGTLDTFFRQPVHITSATAISVSQHMLSQDVSFTAQLPPYPVDSLSDPNSAMSISMREGIREAWFTPVLSNYNLLHVLAIVSKAGNVGSIMLNNSGVASQFHPFPDNPGYMFAYIKPDTGVVYHLTSADKITANYYAAASYGSMDFALGDVSPYSLFNEHPTDTINLCGDDTLVLQAIPGSDYEWSTGNTASEIKVTDPGSYYVTTHHANDKCADDWKRFVVRRNPGYLTSLNLGPDDTVCKGEVVVLRGQGPSTTWSTGEVGDSIMVYTPGTYWAMLQDTCTLDLVADTVVIAEDLCLWQYCNFNLPNAFSPNGDGLNDELLPVYSGELTKYSLRIFNRFGQRVFSTSKPDEGWNGRINGQAADMGVYFYTCLFYCPLRGYVDLKGDITLIR